MTDQPKSRRGFGGMDRERVREIARLGGAAVPGEKRAFFKDRALAASAGSAGGSASSGGGRPKVTE